MCTAVLAVPWYVSHQSPPFSGIHTLGCVADSLLGLYLTDLTFIEDGHPDELATEDESIKMVNFLKCRQLAVVIREIQQFQQCAYAFEKVDVVYDYLQSLVTLSEEELFELSLEQEPREE